MLRDGAKTPTYCDASRRSLLRPIISSPLPVAKFISDHYKNIEPGRQPR
jgi:hypothetical protein